MGTFDLNKMYVPILRLVRRSRVLVLLITIIQLHKYILTGDWLLNKENNPEFRLSVANKI